jgi:hypothetical protein
MNNARKKSPAFRSIKCMTFRATSILAEERRAHAQRTAPGLRGTGLSACARLPLFFLRQPHQGARYGA